MKNSLCSLHLPFAVAALTATMIAPGLARRVGAAPTASMLTNPAMTTANRLEAALTQAGANRAQIERALAQAPAAQRAGM